MINQHISKFTTIVFLLVTMLMLSSCSVIFNNRRNAYQHMGEIKDSVVLVRLKSSNTKIKKLRELGKEAAATKLEKEIAKENQDIVKAINANYTFSDYYFIKAEMNRNLLQKKYGELELMDKNSNTITEVSFLDNGYYVMSFDGVYETQFVEEKPDGSRASYGGGKFYFGVCILDSDGVQLFKPFPKIGNPSYRNTRNKTELVQAYNTELHSFYDRNYRRINKFYGK